MSLRPTHHIRTLGLSLSGERFLLSVYGLNRTIEQRWGE